MNTFEILPARVTMRIVFMDLDLMHKFKDWVQEQHILGDLLGNNEWVFQTRDVFAIKAWLIRAGFLEKGSML
jgi:hypothetical protein